MKNKKQTILLILLLLIFGVTFADAQFNSITNLNLDVWPDTPGPNTQVILKINSYSFDVNSSYITWLIDGRVVKKGVGEKSISVQTGDVGSSIKIEARVLLQNGTEIKKRTTLKISDIDILWHTNTYVPSYYFSKALSIKKSFITLTAMPLLYKNGRKIAPTDLIYEWNLDRKNKASSSGFGRQSFTFKIDGLIKRSHTIKVTVSDIQKTLRAKKSITITPRNPEIIFYENHPLEGPRYQKATTNFQTFSGQEHQFLAVPFYFSINNPNNLLYEWRANGEKEDMIDQKKYLFNFRSLADAVGNILVSLRIINESSIAQQTSESFSINVE